MGLCAFRLFMKTCSLLLLINFCCCASSAYRSRFKLSWRHLIALQVYAFDKVSIIMDNVRGAIKAKVADRWISVSLQELMEQNTLRKSKIRR